MRKLLIPYLGKEIIFEMDDGYTLRGIVTGGDKDFVKINAYGGFRYINLNYVHQFIVLEPEENPHQSKTPPETQPD